ncbi:MAG TPA: class I adenylate-forming enzyme family protein [Trebonia sp.]|nr:class I adenylate-forming enzyme family protein [Trebonia sp.]
MNIVTLLDMAAAGNPDRIAVGRLRSTAADAAPLSYPELLDRARAGAGALRERGATELVYLGVSGNAFAQALFAAAWAGVPLVPLNYRLSRDQLAGLLSKHQGALVVSDLDPPASGAVVTTREWDALCARPAPDVAPWEDDQDATAILLYTSGTTSAPKAAVLRHKHLTSYLLGSVEFGAAGEADTMLVSVPPYHIAGVSNLLSNIYAGRRIVYLESFTPEAWLASVRQERVTHALLVPTMLARLTDHLTTPDTPGNPTDPPISSINHINPTRPADTAVPTLTHLAYGGATMPAPVLERATRLFPHVDFVNAYGLTETSSTIAVLGPDDHRAALTGDPVAKARLGSVGRLLPGIEAQVRAADGTPMPVGGIGDVHVRGDQVSGEYRGTASGVDADGWLATRDRGWIDADGYLFIEGRADDTIIRGGENLAPAEIEDVLLDHPAVAEAAVVGIPDEHWGQDIAAVIVARPGHPAPAADELKTWVRSRLRSAKTPALIVFRDSLPHTPTGKLLRRQLASELVATKIKLACGFIYRFPSVKTHDNSERSPEVALCNCYWTDSGDHGNLELWPSREQSRGRNCSISNLGLSATGRPSVTA